MDLLDQAVLSHRMGIARLAVVAATEWTSDEWLAPVRDAAARLERLLKAATVVPITGDSLFAHIEALGSRDHPVRPDTTVGEALHWVRSTANAAKHDPADLHEAEEIHAGLTAALDALNALRGDPSLAIPHGRRVAMRVAIAELDYPRAGETEWLVHLVSPGGHLSQQIDAMQFEYRKRDDLLTALRSVGDVYETLTWLDRSVPDHWRQSDEFVGFVGFQGRYLDFIRVVTQFQHGLALLPGLARGAGDGRGVVLGIAQWVVEALNAAGGDRSPDVDGLKAYLGLRDTSGLQPMLERVKATLLQGRTASQPLHEPRLISHELFSAMLRQSGVCSDESIGLLVTPEGVPALKVDTRAEWPMF